MTRENNRTEGASSTMSNARTEALTAQRLEEPLAKAFGRLIVPAQNFALCQKLLDGDCYSETPIVSVGLLEVPDELEKLSEVLLQFSAVARILEVEIDEKT